MPIRLTLTLDDLEGDALSHVAAIAEVRGISHEKALEQILEAPFDEKDFATVVQGRAEDVLAEINAPIVRAACELYERRFGQSVDVFPIYCTVTETLVRICRRQMGTELFFWRESDGSLTYLGDFDPGSRRASDAVTAAERGCIVIPFPRAATA